MLSIQTLIILCVIFLVLILIEAILYFRYHSLSDDLTKNSGALCPASQCAHPSSKCNLTSFKINEDGSLTCGNAGIFASKVPNITLTS
jgi:hypothetical protein